MRWYFFGLIFASLSAVASKSITHFENPIQDSRIKFSSCAVEGALIGILEGKMGSVVCKGTLATDPTSQIYAVKLHDESQVRYFQILQTQLKQAVVDPDGGAFGLREWSVSIRELGANLEKIAKAHVGTLKIRQQWEYSEGSSVLSGKVPGTKNQFFGPIFNLDTIDQELKDFDAELGY